MRSSVKASEAKRIRSEGSYQRKKSVSIRHLKHEQYRYTAVVSKKQGGAVERNRVKRIIREIMRTNRERFPNGLYLIYYNEDCRKFDRNTVLGEIEELIGKIAQPEQADGQ